MSLIKSLFLGSEGSYHFCGIPIAYKENSLEASPSLDGVGFISHMANTCSNSAFFRLMSQAYLHVTIHELGHSFANRFIGKGLSQIIIKTDTCSGETQYSIYRSVDAKWRLSAIEAAGPLSNIAFCICKLISAAAFVRVISLPIALIVGGGAIMCIAGELLYAYVSATHMEPNGDFSKIASHGKIHLAVASSALLGSIAFGVFATIKMYNYF